MQLLEEFKEYYERFDHKDINSLEGIYTCDVLFSDPVHRVEGIGNLKDYFSSMCSNLISCRFEFVGETIASDSAWLKWVMHYQHPRLRNGDLLQLTGASYLRLSKENDVLKVACHEDFYDMGSMLYEHTPILGSGVRWLKRQLIGSAT